jgi:hypothetical protein
MSINAVQLAAEEKTHTSFVVAESSGALRRICLPTRPTSSHKPRTTLLLLLRRKVLDILVENARGLFLFRLAFRFLGLTLLFLLRLAGRADVESSKLVLVDRFLL